MADYVGEVKAVVTIDTKQFDSGMKKLAEEAKLAGPQLNSAFGKGFGDQLKTAINEVIGEFKKLIDESSMLNSINSNLKKIADNLSRVSDASKKATQSVKNVSEIKSSFNSASKDVISLANSIKKMSAELSTVSTAKWNIEGIEASIQGASEMLNQLSSNTSTFKGEAEITDAEFKRWVTSLEQCSEMLSQLQAKVNSVKLDNKSTFSLEESLDKIYGYLDVLGEKGLSTSLQLEEGFIRVDNSVINTEEQLDLMMAHLEKLGTTNGMNPEIFTSFQNQLKTTVKEIGATETYTRRLARELRTAGESTGVFVNINEQAVELKASMVQTDEQVNKLVMDLRKLSPAEIITLTSQIERVGTALTKSRMEVSKFYKSMSQLSRENLGMLGATKFNQSPLGQRISSLEGTKGAVNSTIESLRMLDNAFRSTGASGTTAIVKLNGEWLEYDAALTRSTSGTSTLEKELSRLSATQLGSVIAQINELIVATQGANNAARLYRENLASINVQKFNAIPTTPVINTNGADAMVKAQEGNLRRVISTIDKVSVAYEQMGAKGSLSIETVDGKLVKLSSDMVRSSEGARILREAFGNLSNTQLISLERQLQSLGSQTDLLRDKTALCIDTMGNLRMVESTLQSNGRAMDNVSKSSQKATNSLKTQKNTVNALDTAYGMLRRTLSLIVVMFGFQLAMELFEVGKAAADASYKIKKMGSEMGWTAQQTTKFQNQANKLQKIYPKMDMNETAKSVVEMARVYDLTNDQATKFIETAAVFNSAMAKEGRSTKDAGLALKDYLDLGQGWTRRMQEIGATKENLVATGYWDGETQDINAQIKALDAYLEKRHYYKMAQEIYTLDEAYDALKYRIGNFIGQGLQAATPYIISMVKAFFSLLDTIEKIGGALKDNPLFEAVALFAGAAISVGLLSKALSVLKLKIIENVASLAQLAIANPTLTAIAIAIGVIVVAVYELGKAWGWWKDIPSMLDAIAKALGTVQGQVAAVGGALTVALVAFSAKGWLSSSNVIVGAIQNVITKLIEYIGVKKAADTVDATSTGGVTGGVPKGKLMENIGQSFRNIALSTAKAAMYIGAVMILLTEAIVLIQAPMWALAQTGRAFKAQEPQIREGIEGLKLIAPVLAVMLPPIVALMYITNTYGSALKSSWSGFTTALQVIIQGMVLVSVAILSLIAPMTALAGVGYVGSTLKSGMEKGKQAIETMTDALSSLVPVIPLFIVAVIAGAIAVGTEGIGLAVEIGVIASGMIVIAGAIVSLLIPMAAIAGLGSANIDTAKVKQGADRIKDVSEALTYLSTAMSGVATIAWADLSTKVANFFNYGEFKGLADSMKDMDKIIDEMQNLSTYLSNINISDVNAEELKKLGKVAEAVKSIQEAMDSINKVGSYSQTSDASAVFSPVVKMGIEGILNMIPQPDVVEKLKTAVENINNFTTQFNGIGVVGGTDNFQEKVDRIKNAGEAVSQIVKALGSMEKVTGSGGIQGELSSVFFGDTSYATKFGILFTNIKAMNTFATHLSNLNTTDVKGDALNRIVNIASHIPQIVSINNSIRSNLSAINGDVNVSDKMQTLKSNVDSIITHTKSLLDNMEDTSSITGEGINRIVWITQDVVKISDAIKQLRAKFTGDESSVNVDLKQKLYTLLQNFMVIKQHITAFLYNSTGLGDTSGLSSFTTAISQVVGIASKVNALVTTLPAPGNNVNLQQRLYTLLQNLMAIKQFMNTANWNLGGDGSNVDSSGAVSGMASMVTELSTAIQNISSTVDSAIATLSSKGSSLGSAIGDNFKAKISGMGSAMSGQVSTINSAISSANAYADNMSVHFNTLKTRVSSLSGAVQNLKDKIDALPNSKEIKISVSFSTSGSLPSTSGLSFTLPSIDGSTGLAGFGGKFKGLRRFRHHSAPVGMSFVDAFKSLIGGMSYKHYYGSRDNGDVASTLNRGEANCVDGALATLQLARMYGLDGKLGTTLVNGEGHAFAIIEGKIFDATAMQTLGKIKAPNVRYSSSNPTEPKKSKEEPKKEFNIIVDMTDSTFYGDKDFERKIERTFEKMTLKVFDKDKNTGV